jgi:glycosyltransferase involved in cell wall biosynthesis
MNILFLHNNFPGQFAGLASNLASRPGFRVVAVGAETAQSLPNVELHRYRMPYFNVAATHPFARRFDVECRRTNQVLYVLTDLLASGFEPDLIIGHCGWGETLPARSVFPRAKIAIYCEFYYRPTGQDVAFDPEGPQFGIDGLVGLHCKNASTLLSIAAADIGISPTIWQKDTYPSEFHQKIRVLHEGVDTERLIPDARAKYELPGGLRLKKGDEVLTFSARNLEPMRGYHIFMRSLPKILRARPDAQVVIVGGDGVSYGAPPPQGRSWKSIYLEEVAASVDLDRVHFLPWLPYDDYIRILQLSCVHVYLTYPFVLSWSVVEAMALECTIVASDTAPVRELISDGVEGRLTDFHDPSALADKVTEVLAEPSRFQKLGKAARKKVSAEYDRKACLRRALDVLGVTEPAVQEKGEEDFATIAP